MSASPGAISLGIARAAATPNPEFSRSHEKSRPSHPDGREKERTKIGPPCARKRFPVLETLNRLFRKWFAKALRPRSSAPGGFFFVKPLL